MSKKAMKLALEALKLTWNSGMPHPDIMQVSAAIKALEALAEQPAQQQQGPGNLKHLAEICPELNMSNYTIDDVDELNNWAIEVATAIDAMAEQPAPVQQEPVAAAKKDAVFSASIEFIGTLTGMKPPPIEVAPPEILKPFRDFTEKVCSIFAAPQPAQRKPLTDGEIEKLREKTFSTGNPYCPVDSKSMRKAARAIEAAHGIKENT